MSKKNTPQRYFDAPSDSEIARIEKKIREVKKAARKTKKLKIEPYISTVVRCLSAGKSSRNISKIVKDFHGVNLSHSSILRFSRALSNEVSAPDL